MSPPVWPHPVLAAIALAIPATLALAVPFATGGRPFRRAAAAVTVALVLAIVTAVGGIGDAGPDASHGAIPVTSALARLVRLDTLTRVMLLLVGFVALVIVRYSRTYLRGDAAWGRYARALLATLAAVTALVLANDLLALAGAWLGASLALHQLLTFYRDRPQALVAAHKKFLVSRLADLSMLGAIAVVGTSAGRLDLDSVRAWAEASEPSDLRVELAATLVVVAVSLKSAQLPFHGWLVQVMEAPTPVSALLHAGVVNVGGFVLIRLAPLFAHAPLAQTLLVIVGTITAVVASLVMTTRTSVKVALAWSTCAQMGFMLVECGLGAWHLALLHLVAHSLYKAHAFLGSGGTVDAWRVRALSRPQTTPTLARAIAASAMGFAGVAATVFAGASLSGADVAGPVLALPVLVLGGSLPLLAMRGLGGGARAFVGLAGRSVVVGALYLGLHSAVGALVPLPAPATAPLAAIVVVIIGFGALNVVQLLLECRPQGGLARSLQPSLYAGLYLDELFTRATFRVWPPRREQTRPSHTPAPVGRTLEAR